MSGAPMSTALGWVRGIFRRPSSPPRNFDHVHPQSLDGSEPLEEEDIPGYSPEIFYPVKIGQVFNEKYQVICKLGYGATSTVWLCRDLIEHRYLVLKVSIHEGSDAVNVNNELEIYKRLSSVTTSHPGKDAVRKSLGSFMVHDPHGQHHCLIHEPLAMNLQGLCRLFPSRCVPAIVVKTAVTETLKALDFLHRLANVIHTDIKSSNLLHTVEDESVLVQCEEDELNEPSPRKFTGDGFIYRSRELGKPKKWGTLILTDFGEARVGPQPYRHSVQPELYRAPEILLHMNWDCKIDISNLGVLMWDLLEGSYLFDARSPDGNYSTTLHLAEMVAYLGQPKVDFLRTSPIYLDYFNKDGTWKLDTAPPNLSFEQADIILEGDEQKDFLDFLRLMLQWDTKDRWTAKELLKHPWLDVRIEMTS